MNVADSCIVKFLISWAGKECSGTSESWPQETMQVPLGSLETPTLGLLSCL